MWSAASYSDRAAKVAWNSCYFFEGSWWIGIEKLGGFKPSLLLRKLHYLRSGFWSYDFYYS